MTDPSLPPDGDPRDAHLLAALRHAPDRGLAPPAPLTAAILEQARRAVAAPPRPPQQAEPWRVRWWWRWPSIPMTAFGTVAMATLIGVLWVGREVPDTTPALRPGRVATAPATQAPPARPADPMAPPAAAPAIAAADTAEKSGLRGEAEPAPARRPATANARGAGAAPTPPVAREAAVAGPAVDAAVDSAPGAQAKATLPEAELRRGAPARSLADTAPTQATASATSRARSEQALGAAAPATIAPRAQGPAEPELDLPGDVSRVRWQLAAGRDLLHDAVQADWWASLRRATQGRWQRVTDVGASELALFVDGTPRGRLGFEAQAVVWREANGQVWRATASADQVREWREALARW